MKEMMYLPKILGVLEGPSTPKARIQHRTSHALLFRICGESIYYFREKEIKVSEGSVLYIPQDETFSFRKISEGDSRHILINFQLPQLAASAPRYFAPPFQEEISAAFYKINKVWRFSEEPHAKYEMLSLLFHVFAILEQHKPKEYLSTAQKGHIQPAVSYLEEHMFDAGLKIKSLAALCNMSEVSFRHIFSARFGVSPKKYIIGKRLSQAQTILQSGEYKNISEVAYAVGYTDPLYFSKHFKAFYGSAPSESV